MVKFTCMDQNGYLISPTSCIFFKLSVNDIKHLKIHPKIFKILKNITYFLSLLLGLGLQPIYSSRKENLKRYRTEPYGATLFFFGPTLFVLNYTGAICNKDLNRFRFDKPEARPASKRGQS